MRIIHCDRKGTPLGDLRPSAATLTQGTDGTDRLELTLPSLASVDKGDRLILSLPDMDPREYVVTSPKATRENSTPQLSVIAQSSLQDLGLVAVLEWHMAAGSAIVRAVQDLIGAGWTVGNVAGGNLPQDIRLRYKSMLEILQSICDTAGCELYASYGLSADGTRIGSRRVNVVKLRGNQDATVQWRYHFGLRSVKRTVDASAVITRVYPYGTRLATSTTDDYGERLSIAAINGGYTYLEDQSATARWGIPTTDGGTNPSESILIDDTCDNPNVLLAEAKAHLTSLSTPRISYEADVATIGTMPGIGDRVSIIDDTFQPALQINGRILRIQRDLLDSAKTKITLGNYVESWTARMAATEQTLDGLLQDAGTWSNAAKDVLTQDANATMGGRITVQLQPNATIGDNQPLPLTANSATMQGNGLSSTTDGITARYTGWYQLSGFVTLADPGNWDADNGDTRDTIQLRWGVVKQGGGTADLSTDSADYTSGDFSKITHDARKDMPALTTWLDAGDTVRVVSSRANHNSFTAAPVSIITVFRTPGGK